ncbi:Uncharacterised protein [Legionella steigerwaltii]|uniref:Uncharacterized protein n=1 Tax=Legionella steigerwaltii TaxID=460 RepID=A0A378L776_9GAMM|nr:hypothetical protein [Legionella steigerwaltii]KTD72022.1 hypothetical protein Lstg_2723 [Legionella steigerwaltii]STY21688.1 Uncharacterised protein [Legionella steigerwaltii]
MKSKFEESQRLMKSVHNNFSAWQKMEMPPQLREEHQTVTKATRQRVEELEKSLADAAPPDPEGRIDKVYESLLELNKSTTAAQLLSQSVMMTYDQSKKEGSQKALQEMGTDALRVAWNLATGLIREDSKSLTEKMMGFAKACVYGTIGMCQGALQGYDKGSGFFNTVKNMVVGGFEQGMSGYNKSLALSIMSDEERAKRIIADLKAEHEKVLSDPDTSDPIKQARKQVIEEEDKYLKELEQRLEKSSTPKERSNAIRSLELLQLSNAATSLQNSGLSFIHRVALGEDKNVNPKALADIGKNIVNITKNVNQILDDPSQKWPSKLWTMTKAYASAAQEGVKSFVHGFEGANWKEKALNGIVSAFSGFTSKFAQSLEQSKVQESSEPTLSAPPSTHKIGHTLQKLPSVASKPSSTVKKDEEEGYELTDMSQSKKSTI